MRRMLLCTLIAILARTAAADCSHATSCGSTIAASLSISNSSCLDSAALTYDLYTFAGKIGQAVTISASSPSFPPQLVLLDPTNTQRLATSGAKGATIALPFTLDRNGTWTVMMRNTEVGGDGPYTLRIQCAAPPSNTDHGFVLTVSPVELSLTKGASASLTVGSIPVPPFSADVQVTATEIPQGVTLSQTSGLLPRGVGSFQTTVSVGATAVGGLKQISFAGKATDGNTATAGVSLFIDAPCGPPNFGPTDNGGTQTTTEVVKGRAATFTATHGGTAPFTYQWYRGFGSNFPVENGTAATLTTPALTSDDRFWVRASNACGSRDSAMFNVRVVDTPTRHRSVTH